MPYGMMGYGYAPYGGGYGAYGSKYGSKAAAYNSTDSASSKPTYPPTSAPVVDVGLYDNHFRPVVTYISAGTVLRFTNRGRHHHTVTSDEGLWDSGVLRPGAGYAVFFPMPGTFYYHCKAHPHGMKGWVVVRGAYD
jgi:plastocyanin